MNPVRMLVASILVASSVVACAAPTEEELASEETGEASSALIDNGGGTGGTGLTASECTSCGCYLVYIGKEGDCRQYKCVCENTEDAKCAGGKARLVSVPDSPKRFFNNTLIGSSGGAVLAP